MGRRKRSIVFFLTFAFCIVIYPRLTASADPGTVFAGGLSGPFGMAFDASGSLYITQISSMDVIQITPEGSASVYVGGFTAAPEGVAFNNAGVLHVSDDTGTIYQ